MKILIKTIKWDFILMLRYNIIAISAVVTLLYSILLLLSNTSGFEKGIAAIIFSDPVMYGYLFVSVMVLFEKESGTLQAFSVTPSTARIYIASKTIAFSLLALLSSSVIMLAAQPENFNLPTFLLAIILSSALFIFIGIISISFVKNFNQFIIVIPLILTPVALPFLDYFNLLNSNWFYIIPTQACLLLFKGSVMKIGIGEYTYSILYLMALNYIAYRLALYFYFRKILKSIRYE
jgi:fluoroquinolone transport system permease protein